VAVSFHLAKTLHCPLSPILWAVLPQRSVIICIRQRQRSVTMIQSLDSFIGYFGGIRRRTITQGVEKVGIRCVILLGLDNQ